MQVVLLNRQNVIFKSHRYVGVSHQYHPSYVDEPNCPVDSRMSKLSIDPRSRRDLASKDAVADSWEDKSSTESDTDQADDTNTETFSKKTSHLSPSLGAFPAAPPPTPLSPQFAKPPSFAASSLGTGSGELKATNEGVSEKRPEKTTQTAARMIAAGLGVKAPRQTEEQKEYERSIRENERRLLNEQKEERKRREEEKEKVKRAMWDG